MLHIRWNDITGKYDAASPLPAQPAKTIPTSRPRN
jgi:hypothetical protein